MAHQPSSHCKQQATNILMFRTGLISPSPMSLHFCHHWVTILQQSNGSNHPSSCGKDSLGCRTPSASSTVIPSSCDARVYVTMTSLRVLPTSSSRSPPISPVYSSTSPRNARLWLCSLASLQGFFFLPPLMRTLITFPFSPVALSAIRPTSAIATALWNYLMTLGLFVGSALLRQHHQAPPLEWDLQVISWPRLTRLHWHHSDYSPPLAHPGLSCPQLAVVSSS
jgi:hypothetical protein